MPQGREGEALPSGHATVQDDRESLRPSIFSFLSPPSFLFAVSFLAKASLCPFLLSSESSSLSFSPFFRKLLSARQLLAAFFSFLPKASLCRCLFPACHKRCTAVSVQMHVPANLPAYEKEKWVADLIDTQSVLYNKGTLPRTSN